MFAVWTWGRVDLGYYLPFEKYVYCVRDGVGGSHLMPTVYIHNCMHMSFVDNPLKVDPKYCVMTKKNNVDSTWALKSVFRSSKMHNDMQCYSAVPMCRQRFQKITSQTTTASNTTFEKILHMLTQLSYTHSNSDVYIVLM